MKSGFYAWREAKRKSCAADEDVSYAEHQKYCKADRKENCPIWRRENAQGQEGKPDAAEAERQDLKDPNAGREVAQGGGQSSDDGQYDERGFRSVKPEEYVKIISAAKDSVSPEIRWRVDVKSVDDYSHCKALKVTRGGSCYAVKENGDIISVCKNGNDNATRGRSLIEAAIQDGGDRLDTYDGNFGFYVKCGLKPISWTKWDAKFAPDDWKSAKDGGFDVEPENIVFYAVGKYEGSSKKGEWESSVKPFEDQSENGEVVKSGYDLAQGARDVYIENKNIAQSGGQDKGEVK